MKNKVKILSLAISCLLLLGVAFGITSFAADDAAEPTVSIAKKTLSYEGAIRILYAVDSENLSAGDSVKIVFSYNEFAAPTGKLVESNYAYVNGVEGSKTLDGKTYDVICSNGFAPALMNKPVYAIPVVVNSNNEVVASGEMHKFSIFEYCTTRFAQTPTADQYELYTAMLEYGASVQEALITNDDVKAVVDAYGYADAYYVVNATVKVDGAVAATEKLCYRDANATINPKKTYNGKIFAGFENANGEKVGSYGATTASSWNYYDTTLAIGNNDLTLNYKTAGNIQSWTDADGNDLTLNGSGLTHPGSEHSAVTFDKGSDSILSMDVINGELVLDAPKVSSWRPLEFVNKNATAGAVGKTYVFETDLKIVDDPATAGTDNVLMQFGFNKRADYGATEETFVLFALNRTSSTKYKLQTLDKTGGDWANLATGLEFGKYYNLRIEYKIESIGSTSTTPANSTAKGTVNVYIDGELVSTFTATGFYDGIPNGTFAGVGMLDRAYKGVSSHNYYFDNTYIATED